MAHASLSMFNEVIFWEAFCVNVAGSMPGTVKRYEVPGLRALKYVVDGALPGGIYASLRAGVHWQKSAAYLLLDIELDIDPG